MIKIKKTSMIALLPILALAMEQNIPGDAGGQAPNIEHPPLDPNLPIPPLAAIELALINAEAFNRAFNIIPKPLVGPIENHHVDELVQLFTNLHTALLAVPNADPSWIDDARFYGERAADTKQRRPGERHDHVNNLMEKFLNPRNIIRAGLEEMKRQHQA